MDPTDLSIEDLVKEIKQGKIRIPEMQRGYVWNKNKVCNLLDSLYQGYPSGTILVWRHKSDENVVLRDSAISQEDHKKYVLLLDGQQRLTSLTALLCDERVKIRGKERSIDVLFNLEHPDYDESLDNYSDLDEDEQNLDKSMPDANEEEKLKKMNEKVFAVSNKKIAKYPHWISVSEIFKQDDAYEVLKNENINVDMGSSKGKKYRKRLEKLLSIKKYRYKIDIVDSGKLYKEVSDIFVRVNSGGANLRGHDLASAQITAKWQGALEVFQKAEEKYQDYGYNLGMSTLLKSLMAITTGQCRFKELPELQLERLKQGWSEADDAIDHSIKFLRNNVKVESSALLSSPFIVATIAYHGCQSEFKIHPDEEKKLCYWALVANVKRRYSRGSSETFLDQDLKSIREAKSESESKSERLLSNLEKQMGRLDIKANEFSGRDAKSAHFKTMFLAFQNAGAADWLSSVSINIDGFTDRRNKKESQFHHLFPQGRLKANGYDKKKINDMRNLTFLSARTNNELRDSLPEEYLKKINKKHLIDHCIPQTKTLWKLENYDKFIEVRGELIAKRLNEFLNSKD